MEISKEFKKKCAFLRKLLKEKGTYKEELEAEIELAGKAWIAILINEEEALTAPTIETVSREGDERTKQNPAMKFYYDGLDRYQRALKHLGLVYDSKEDDRAEQGHDAFMARFSEDD